MASQLLAAVKNNQGVRELAKNPLLLTLLAAMQQNSITLPRQRADLYSTVAKTLLENRNLDKNLPPLPEAEAMQRLGPVAWQMHAEDNSFLQKDDVVKLIAGIIGQPTNAADLAEAGSYLARVGERSGLFVERTGEFYGFFHRTFEEYFAARHLLRQIELDRAQLPVLAALARQTDDHWREVFLLAVAHKSGEDGTTASQLISTLLDSASAPTNPHDLLLAATCIIESQPATIDLTLQARVATLLLEQYT